MKIFKLLSIADFFTMGNAIMGFTGMAIAIKSRHLEWAIACLFMGAILDGVDGIVARRFAKKWNLGDYLDIMCDYTTFCVAPSVIMLELFYDQHFLKFVHITPPFSNIMIYIACGAVLIAGLMRLSRFCYEPGSRVFFYGVASPGCAFTLSLVLLLYHIYDPTQPEYHNLLFPIHFSPIIIFISALAIAFLMICDIKYPKIKGPPVYIAGVLILTTIISMLYELHSRVTEVILWLDAAVWLSYILFGPLFLSKMVKKGKVKLDVPPAAPQRLLHGGVLTTPSCPGEKASTEGQVESPLERKSCN